MKGIMRTGRKEEDNGDRQKEKKADSVMDLIRTRR